MRKKTVVLLLCIAIMCGSTSYAANLLNNGSFETPEIAENTYSLQPVIDGWDAFMYIVNYPDGLWGLQAQDGDQFAFINPGLARYNWTSHVIQPSTTYTISYYIGRDNDPNDTCKYDVEVFAVSEINNYSLPGYTPMLADASSLVLNPGEWKKNTMSYTTGASGGPIGKYLTVWINSRTIANSYVFLDGFEVTAKQNTPVVPEPSSIIALMSGLAGICGLAIRRRK